MACLSTASYYFNVNGEMTMPIKGKKGLRQGDPISPYLFVLCMEYLNRCLLELKDNKDYKYHPKCKKLNLYHVCFADDLLLFSRGDAQSIRQLFSAFQKFSFVSGLRANQAKTSIYFGGVPCEVHNLILEEFQISKGDLPFKYLGVPLSSKKLSIAACQPLIKNVLSRIDRWASKLLSYAGRLQLIKSIWCSNILVPSFRLT